jgi:hypothetical protein
MRWTPVREGHCGTAPVDALNKIRLFSGLFLGSGPRTTVLGVKTSAITQHQTFITLNNL